MKREKFTDDPSPHPFWDRRVIWRITPRMIAGLIVLALVFAWAGLLQRMGLFLP